MKARQGEHKQNQNSKKMNDSSKYEDDYSKKIKSNQKRNAFRKAHIAKRVKVLNNLRASLENYICLLIMILMLSFINSQRELDDQKKFNFSKI